METKNVPDYVPVTGWWSDKDHWAAIEKKDEVIKRLTKRLDELEDDCPYFKDNVLMVNTEKLVELYKKMTVDPEWYKERGESGEELSKTV